MGSKQKSQPAAKVDGRIQRSVRSRELIINAMLALIEEGNLAPTAQQVAERAKVGMRSVFRHFADMESMFDDANKISRDSYEYLFVSGDRDGSLDERILHATEQRAEAFESLKQMLLATQMRRWNSPMLRKNYSAGQRRLRKDLDDWLPELAALSSTHREAVDAIASFETWHRLREHQGLTQKASIEVIVSLLKVLIHEN